MNDQPEICCYALRRLNPFLGVLQVIETTTGRASTSNGLVWHIELLADQPTGWGSLDCDAEEQVWYLYAIWSEVRKRAGFNIKRLWFDRDSKCTNADVPGGKQFCDNDFPIYGIREDWSDEKVSALVQRYIDWIAPSLLTLPSLEDSRRARLESRLERQARSIEYHWRLYPKILDANKITAARVQTRLLFSESPMS